MRLLSLILLAFCSTSLQAQYDDLLQNSKISWVAEYTTDYELNPAYNDNMEWEYNLLEVVRMTNSRAKNGLFPNSSANLPYYLSKELYEGLRAGFFDCYSDPQFEQPLTNEQVQACFIWKDSSDGSGFVLENEYTLESFVTFRIRQVLYFNQSKQKFGARLLAIAPVAWVSDADGYMSQHEPLLWIKLPALSKKQGRRLPKKANYTLQTLMKDNTISMDQVEVKKGKIELQAWAAAVVDKPTHQVLSANAFEPLNPAALKKLVFTADTVTALNDQGQTVIDQIIQNNALEDVKKLRLVQNWYYDERRRTLDFRLVAVAPMATINAAGGLFRFDKPLFYIKY